MKITKIISIMLLAAAVIYTAPLGVYAAVTVNEVFIFNYEYPVIGETPADMPKLDLPFAAGYLLDDYFWCYAATKEPVPLDSGFKDNVRYCLLIRLLPEENFVFSENVTVTLNDENDIDQISVEPDRIILYTSASYPYYGRINEVVIDNFSLPSGENGSDLPQPKVPEGAHYSLLSQWYDVTRGFYTGSSFCPGVSYSYHGDLTSHAGYYFSGNASFVINGDDITIDGGSSYFGRNLIELRSKPFLLGEDKRAIIDTVEVFNFSAPVIGQSTLENLPSIIVSRSCLAFCVNWYRADGSIMGYYDTFRQGCGYYLAVTVTASAGFMFCGDELPEILINGDASLIDKSRTEYGYGDEIMLTFCTVTVTPGESDVKYIDYVNIEGFSLPSPGQTYAEIASSVTVGEDAPYTLGHMYCVDDTESKVLNRFDRFVSGHSYYFAFAAAPKEGYRFAPTDNTAIFYINGEKELVDSWANAYMDGDTITMLEFGTVVFTVSEPEEIPVRSVEVQGFKAPYANQSAGDNAEKLDAAVSAEQCFIYAFWINVTDDEYMTDSDLFEAGKTYRLEFRFRAEEGYFFDPDALPAITVNGDAGLVNGELTYTDSDRLQLTFYTVDMTPFLYGDCNGDGKADGKDLIRLRRHLVGFEAELFPGADCNGDGEINGKDLIILRKYLLTEDLSILGPH